jgi:hypothetical protein
MLGRRGNQKFFGYGSVLQGGRSGTCSLAGMLMDRYQSAALCGLWFWRCGSSAECRSSGGKGAPGTAVPDRADSNTRHFPPPSRSSSCARCYAPIIFRTHSSACTNFSPRSPARLVVRFRPGHHSIFLVSPRARKRRCRAGRGFTFANPLCTRAARKGSGSIDARWG